MTNQKSKLLAVLAVFAAIGVITGTGAFTTVSADRTATVNVAGDQNALLQVEPYNGPNGIGEGNTVGADLGSSDGYADIQDGTLLIDLNGFSDGTPKSSGVNLEAVTTVDGVFNVTNQGTQDVTVYINTTGDNPDTVTFFAGAVADNDPIDTELRAVSVPVGETITVSMQIDTVGKGLSKSDALVSEITIYANASSN
ncbi:MAG: DUF1102 domain-containing protein [Halobacteriales archaeon]